MNWQNTIKYIFNISLACSIVLLVIFLFFINEEGKVDLQLRFRAPPQCDFANVYYTPDQRQLIRIPLAKNDEFNTYKISIPTSTSFFRFDPCNNQTTTEIKSIDVYYKNKKAKITKDSINKWLCHNCTFENAKESLLIKPLNGNPCVLTREFNKEIREFNLERINLAKKTICYLLLIAMILPIFIFLISKVNIVLIGGLSLYALAVAAIGFNLDVIKALFPPVEIGAQKIVGYIHYIGYPFLFDVILYLFIVVLPLFIFAFIVILKNYINTLRKKNDRKK